jgi:hypothetical protein
MPKFTVWIQQADRGGACHISAHEADSAKDAIIEAIAQTIADWYGDKLWADDVIRRKSDLHVLGVAKGEVEIIEWNNE